MCRFDEEVGRVELDYPRDMSMWRGIGYHIDTAFQYQGMVFCSYTKINIYYLSYNDFIFVWGIALCNFLILNQCFFSRLSNFQLLTSSCRCFLSCYCWSNTIQAKHSSSKGRATGNLMIII